MRTEYVEEECGLDFLKKTDGDCVINLLFSIRRQLLRDVVQFVQKSSEQRRLEIFTKEIYDFGEWDTTVWKDPLFRFALFVCLFVCWSIVSQSGSRFAKCEA